ncbi:Uncharacterised protein [Halioglobus japonicus]|nr:Uncharacterised protein [Halioglobus japonicus]
MKISTILCLAALLATLLFGCSNNNSSNTNTPGSAGPQTEPQPEPEVVKKVLLIGVDGLMYSYIDAVDDPLLNEPETPNFDRLTIVPALTGGYFQTSTLQATSSGPGWASILSGTWVDRHGIASNNLQPLAAPAVFSLLDQRDPGIDSGSFAVWIAINFGHFAKEMPLVERKVSIVDRKDDTLNYDDFMSGEVVGELENPQSSLGFLYVHLDDMDAAGHNCGWCTLYEEALQVMDDRVGQILDAVERRERDFDEEWLVILTSDHGHVQAGGHGGNSLLERTSLIGVNRSELMNTFFHNASEPLPLTDDEAQNTLMGRPAVVSIVPTVLDYLGYPAVREDNFAGASLISDLGVYRLIATVSQEDDFSAAEVQLHWLNGDQVKEVRIYRDNELIAQLGSDTTTYTDTLTLADSGAGVFQFDYAVEADIGTPLASQATFVLGVQPERVTVEQDAILQVAFDESLLPLGWVPGTAAEPTFGAGTSEGDSSLLLDRELGYASWIKPLDDTRVLSIGLRMRVDGAVESDPNVVSNKDWSGGTNPGFTIALAGDGIQLNIGDGRFREDTAAIIYSKEEWLYVVAIIDLENESMSLYVADPVFGLTRITQPTGGVTSIKSEYPINIGEGGDGFYNIGRHYDAAVSELIVFDRALNELEVRALAAPPQ